MVFTHYKAPLAGTRELAEKIGRIVKKTGKGEKLYIAWVDTTADHKALERNIIDTEQASRELCEGYILWGLDPSARGALKQEFDVERNVVAWARRTKRGIVEYLEQSFENRVRVDPDRAHWWPIIEEIKEDQERARNSGWGS